MSMPVKDKLLALAIDRTKAASGKGNLWVLASISGVVIAAIAVALVFGGRQQSQAAATPRATGLPTKSAAPLSLTEPEQLPEGMIASGYVVARRSATVSTDIAGRLKTVLFEEGASVKKGQLLAELDDELAKYDLQLAQAKLQSARANVQAVEVALREGEAQLQRAEQLIKSATISQAALEAARSRSESLKAQHDSTVADTAVTRIAVARQIDFVERHKIRAPFDGVIIAKNAQAGEIMSPSSGGGEFTRTGIATLVDMASLEVEVDVNEGQIAHVSEGQRAFIVLDAYPDFLIPGKVIAIIPTADKDRATIHVRVAFDELDPRILPQMSAKVTFERAGD